MSEVMATLYQCIVEMKELSMGFDQKNNIVDTIVEICFIWTVAIIEIGFARNQSIATTSPYQKVPAEVVCVSD